MPRVTPQDARLIVDHVLGDPSVPAAAVNKLIAALPFPSDPTPRLRRALLLRRLAADPISSSSLDTLQLLASLPASASASASPIAAAHIAVAALRAACAKDFDAAARALFAYPNGRARAAVEEGGSPALASDEIIATADQFEAAVGNNCAQYFLRRLWGDRFATEKRVRELLDAEWAAIGPSLLEAAAELIVETWIAADEATRVKFRNLAGEGNTREILGKLEEPTSRANPISIPAVEKVIDVLKTSCPDLYSVVEDFYSVVEDPLSAAKAVADEVVAAMLEKGFSLNAEEVRGQPTTCGIAGPSAPNDKDKGPGTGKPHNLMDWNPTARTFQWEESPGPESSRRPHLPSPRRVPVSPLPPGENKNRHRRARKKWCLLEEETLRKGVEQYGSGNWKDILNNNLDVFIGRTAVDLKDKWRNMTKR